jgi:L-ascorbate metabolism protein UlaG (beta-lactamase superfamily)
MTRRRTILVSLAIAVAGAISILSFMKLWRPFGGRVEGARLARVRSSPNWRDGKFRNLVKTNKLDPGSVWRTLYLQFAGGGVRSPVAPIPIHRTSADELRKPSALRAVWIGHASVLVDIDGMRILTDPIWSERCSPFESMGPRRFHPPPISLADTGKVDAVLISHDHYDHLDMKTIQALTPRGTIFFVPLGIGAHLERWDVPPAQIRELDWKDQSQLGSLKIVALPARHYSGRRVMNGDETQWASWAVIGPSHRVYFSGDTGFFESMNDIGTSFGPFDLTLIKIGAYGPTWLDIHMDPEHAVQTHIAVQGKVMMPVHWGTFNLAYHDWWEPADRLVKAATGRITFVVPRPGEVIEPPVVPPLDPWWRQQGSSP